ncbi:secreted protein [Rhodopirellula europaea SH398]|jgi:hypothetical protein|uniref:Secreted protein n=1 Tax=Rhodopirellula europaea SH398 TaxID=1263868 RepID=M5SCV1_9BACT|nr:secreted protein [Rhodopirellula europaea SH398]
MASSTHLLLLAFPMLAAQAFSRLNDVLTSPSSRLNLWLAETSPPLFARLG